MTFVNSLLWTILVYKQMQINYTTVERDNQIITSKSIYTVSDYDRHTTSPLDYKTEIVE